MPIYHHHPRSAARLALLACAALLLACGPGCLYVGLGVGARAAVDALAGSDSGGGAQPHRPPLIDGPPALSRDQLRDGTGAPSATRIAIEYRLVSVGGDTSPEADLTVEWRLDTEGAPFRPATGVPGPGHDGETGLPTTPEQGPPLRFVWNAGLDLAAQGLVEEDVVVRLTPRREGTPGRPREVRLRAGNRAPLAVIVGGGVVETVGRDVITRFEVSDSAGDDATVTLSVGAPGNPPRPVNTLLGTRGTEVHVAARPEPGSGDFVWDTIDRFGVANVAAATLTLAARDRFGGTGTSTAVVHVVNDGPPAVVELTMGLPRGQPLLDGRVPIRFRLVDAEADIDPDGPSGRPDVRVEIGIGSSEPVEAQGILLRENGRLAGVASTERLRARPLGVDTTENIHTFLWDPRAQGLSEIKETDVVVIVTPLSSGAPGVAASAARNLLSRDLLLSTGFTNAVTPASMRAFDVLDMDGDGLADIVAAEATATPALALFRGNGNRTFAAGAVRRTLPGTTAPVDLACGDLDGDGRTDAVVSHTGLGVTPLRNAGGGTFTALALVPVAGDPRGLALGDVDRDGRLDLVVARRGAGLVSIFPGAGDGTFGAGTDLAVGPSPTSVVLADLDGDDRLDLVADGRPDGLSVRLGLADGGFGPESLVEVPGAPIAFAVSDLESDGVRDIMVLTDGQMVGLRGLGDGTFAPPEVTPEPPSTAFRLGDIDGDGREDVMLFPIVQTGPPLFFVIRGLGGGRLGARNIHPLNGIAGVLCDVNGDGRLDPFVNGSTTGAPTGNLVSIGNPVPISKLAGQSTVIISANLGIEAPDLDRDGRVDALTVLSTARRLLSIIIKPDGELKSTYEADLDGTPAAFAVGDFVDDADGARRVDVAVALSAPSELRLYRGVGDGTFVTLAAVPLPATPTHLALGKIDGGESVDLAVAMVAPGGVSVTAYLGDGGGGFAPVASASPAVPPLATLGLADMDLDGKLDLVLGVALGAAEIRLRPGLGDGTFGDEAVVPMLVNLNTVLPNDVDGDGFVDLLVGRQPGGGQPAVDQFMVRRGLGGGRYGPLHGFSFAQNFNVRMRPADLTGDGRIDLAFVSLGLGVGGAVSVELLPDLPTGAPGRGDGQGTPMRIFRAATTSTGQPPALPACGDFDGDGHPDILTAGNTGVEVALRSQIASTSRPSIAVPGLPGVRFLPAPPIEPGSLQPGRSGGGLLLPGRSLPASAPSAGRHARGSLAYTFSPEGTTLPAATLTLPLHASLTKEDLEERVIRVFAEERTLLEQEEPAIDGNGQPVHARVFEVARRDPGNPSGNGFPAGVVSAEVDPAAGTIAFASTRLLRFQAFVELPPSATATVYRETFDGRAEEQPGLAPRPGGWSAGGRWRTGRPLPPFGPGAERPAPASLPSLISIGIGGDYGPSLAETVTSCAFRLGLTPDGHDAVLKVRSWHDLGTGDAASIVLVLGNPAAPGAVRRTLATFSGLDGTALLRPRRFDVTGDVLGALGSANVTGAGSIEARLELTFVSDGAVEGRGIFLDDIELGYEPQAQ